MTKLREVDVARPIVQGLQDSGWEVYQEVEPKRGKGGVADIVAKLGSVIWVIEVKAGLQLRLLEQAWEWRDFAHMVSIAIPKTNPKRGHRAAQLFCRNYGIGIIQVSAQTDNPMFWYTMHPRLNRRIFSYLWNSLNERQKTFAEAGSADGKRWTPFYETCHQIRKVVQQKPGIHFKELMDRIQHHYSSSSTARQCVSQYLQMTPPLIEGVEAKKEGNKLRVYPKEKVANGM